MSLRCFFAVACLLGCATATYIHSKRLEKSTLVSERQVLFWRDCPWTALCMCYVYSMMRAKDVRGVIPLGCLYWDAQLYIDGLSYCHVKFYKFALGYHVGLQDGPLSGLVAWSSLQQFRICDTYISPFCGHRQRTHRHYMGQLAVPHLPVCASVGIRVMNREFLVHIVLPPVYPELVNRSPRAL